MFIPIRLNHSQAYREYHGVRLDRPSENALLIVQLYLFPCYMVVLINLADGHSENAPSEVAYLIVNHRVS